MQATVDRFIRGEVSAPVALMELLLATSDAGLVARTLPRLQAPPERLRQLVALADEHASGCATIAAMLNTGLDSSEPATSVTEGIARTRRLFDESVRRSEEASVALYSLGSPEVLAAATDEAVAVLDAWGVLGAGRDGLEIGCGIGRFLVPLASRLRSVVGLDVSPGMVDAARRRTAALANVEVRLTDGQDMSYLAPAAFDLVYSVDTFPYLVLSGRALVEAHLRDAARVLRPGGDLVVFNYAYGRSREVDVGELRELGEAAGLTMLRGDEAPFRLWNGLGFHLRRA